MRLIYTAIQRVLRCWSCILLFGIMPGGLLRADVTVSAAISLQPALEKAAPDLEKAAGEKIVFNFGASGTLAGQIQQGAPVDLFISADRATVQKLIDAGAAEKNSERAIAGNELVLIFSPLSSDTPPKDFTDLGRVRRLAIGDPKIVPAGVYARELLTKLKLWDEVEKSGKLVTAENVAQVLTFVRRGDADTGIVYASDVRGILGVRVIATADPVNHSPIEYMSTIIATSKHREAALRVQQALTGEKVQSILKDSGFVSPPAIKTAK